MLSPEQTFEKILAFLAKELPSPSASGMDGYLSFAESQLENLPGMASCSVLHPALSRS